MQSCLALIPDDTERVYLAYSGGLDSSVLLHLLLSLDNSFTLIPWHVNHGLLEAAARMEQFCIDQARHYGLQIRVDHLGLSDVGSNIEAEARRQRYRLFAASSGPGDCILTAHHADDQAETFLLNALRGSGSAGLRGIARQRGLGEALLLRPLLDFSRRQLESYAAEHALAWFDDPSNEDSRFDRNYLRNEVIPSLRLRWPHFHEALSTAGQLQAETQQVLDEIARLDFEALAQPRLNSDPVLDLAGMLQLSSGRCKNLLRYWVAQAGLAAIPNARLRELTKQLHAKPGAVPEIAMSGYSIRLYDLRLFLVRDDALRRYSGEFEFGLQPRIEIEDFGLHWQRDEIFKRLQAEDHNQQLTLKFRDDGKQNSDRRRLKRLFQQQRVPPWERAAVAQVYLDGKLCGLLS
ncbi:MAG: tRNA lysidine(34) synthetase TilS [Gammaproteobacteria bacterium]|nr:tRNA lysidine(34) synthetase TilS [Gammaproteobacteria bacterium]